MNLTNINSFSGLNGLNLESSKKTNKPSPFSIVDSNSDANTNGQDSSLVSFIASNNSRIKNILKTRQTSISKLATGVLDKSALVKTAQDGLKQANDLLNSIKGLLTQAEDGSLTTQSRQEITQKVKAAVDEYEKIIDSTQYSNQKILTSDSTIYLPVSDSISEKKVKIKLTDNSINKLGLNQLDTSTQSSSKRSLEIVNKAIQTIQKNSNSLKNTTSQLNQAADVFIKSLQGILKFQNTLNADSAASSAQNIDSSNLLSAHNPRNINNIQDLLN